MVQYNDSLKRDAGQCSLYGEECERCPALVLSRQQVTFGYGVTPNAIMFVGEAPGQKGCNVTGIPFTRDRSGRFWQFILQKTGFVFEKVYTTNICKCSPRGNRNPEEKEIDNCLPYLINEVKAVKPKIVVTLGRVASRVFLNTNSFSVVHDAGSLFPSGVNWFDGEVLVLPHPAYILRGGNKEKKEYIKEMEYVYRLYLKSKVIDTKILDVRWQR